MNWFLEAMFSLTIRFAAIASIVYFFEKKTYVQHPSDNRELKFDIYFAFFYVAVITVLFNPVFYSLTTAITNFAVLKPFFGGALADLPYIIQIPLMLFTLDMAFYWKHRLDHAWRPMWVFHLLHHHQDHLNFLSGSRSNLFNTAFIRLICLLTFLKFGFDIKLLLVFGLVFYIVVGFSHVNTRIRIRWLEYIVTTPHVHRWHHSLDKPDKNFALIFPVIDIMFGTFYRPDHAPTRMGVESPRLKNSIYAYHAYAFKENYRMILESVAQIRQKLNKGKGSKNTC